MEQEKYSDKQKAEVSIILTDPRRKMPDFQSKKMAQPSATIRRGTPQPLAV